MKPIPNEKSHDFLLTTYVNVYTVIISSVYNDVFKCRLYPILEYIFDCQHNKDVLIRSINIQMSRAHPIRVAC